MKPFVTYAADYHDFNLIKRSLNHAGFKADYKELDCGYSELISSGPHGMYHAVFFLCGDNIDSIVNEWSEKIWTV